MEVNGEATPNNNLYKGRHILGIIGNVLMVFVFAACLSIVNGDVKR